MPKLVSGTSQGPSYYGHSDPKMSANSGARHAPRISTLKHSPSNVSEFVLLGDVDSKSSQGGGFSVTHNARPSQGGGWPLEEPPQKV